MDRGGCRYDLVFFNRSKRADQIRFEVEGLEELGDSLKAWVIDPASGTIAAVDSAALSVALSPGAEKHRILAVGDEGYGRAMLDGLGSWKFRLLGVAPNPSRGVLNVKFIVPTVGIERIACELFDASGRMVWRSRLGNGQLRPGVNHLAWDGATAFADRAASGVYLLRLLGFDRRGKAVKRREQQFVRVP
jgi:hypothetical protein